MTVITEMIFFSKQTDLCRFKKKKRDLYDVTLRYIAIGQYYIYIKKKKKFKVCFVPKLRHFCTAKMVTYQEKVDYFLIQRPQIS